MDHNIDTVIEKTTKDYAKYLDVDLESKLTPLTHSIDDMLTRLEEYKTMVSVIEQERLTLTDVYNTVLGFSDNLDQLWTRIEAVEKLTAHIDLNLNYLEAELEKADEKLGVTESSLKVSTILTPLFVSKLKKTPDNNPPQKHSELFRTEDYFDSDM